MARLLPSRNIVDSFFYFKKNLKFSPTGRSLRKRLNATFHLPDDHRSPSVVFRATGGARRSELTFRSSRQETKTVREFRNVADTRDNKYRDV